MIKLNFTVFNQEFRLLVSNGRYTIYIGDSSVGKTTLMSALLVMQDTGIKTLGDGYQYYIGRGYYDISGVLEKQTNTLVFVDESIVNSLGRINFKTLSWKQNNHLILTSRFGLKCIPYGIFDCFEMVRQGNIHITLPLYPPKFFALDNFRPDIIFLRR